MPFEVLLLVMLGVLVVAAPFLAISALVRHGRLRKEFEIFKADRTKQHGEALRQIAELKARIAEARAGHVGAEKEVKSTDAEVRKETIPLMPAPRPNIERAAAPPPIRVILRLRLLPRLCCAVPLVQCLI